MVICSIDIGVGDRVRYFYRIEKACNCNVNSEPTIRKMEITIKTQSDLEILQNLVKSHLFIRVEKVC